VPNGISTISPGAQPDLETESFLRLLVTDFNSAPLANGTRIRDLMELDVDAFRVAAVSVLSDCGDTAGSRYLVNLLWNEGLLTPTLSDIFFPKDVDLNTAKTAAKVDPQLHIRIIGFLVNGMFEGQEIEESTTKQLMEILGEISDTVGIQPLLRQLLLHPNSRIRSKITLLVGRGQAGLRAMEKLLKDADARVRANAVEALWTNCDPQVKNHFREALLDSDNRVVGNATFGLHSLGDTQSISAVLRLATHESTVFRATGAWVMGRTQDPRFLPILGRLLAGSKGQLRKTAFSAVASMKKAAALRAGPPSLAIRILSVENVEHPSGQTTRAAMVATSEAQWDPPELKATEVIISVNGEPVSDYSCVEQRNDLISVGFIMPNHRTTPDFFRDGLELGMKKCLEAKKRPEPWSILRFHEGRPKDDVEDIVTSSGPSPAAEKQDAAKPAPTSSFTTDSAEIEAAIDSGGNEIDIYEAAHAMITGLSPSRGSRNVLILVDSDNAISLDQKQKLAQAALAGTFSVNVVSTAENTELKGLCSLTSGIFRQIADPEDIESDVILLYKSLRRRYVLEVTRGLDAPPIERLSVQVHRPSEMGESTWCPATAGQKGASCEALPQAVALDCTEPKAT
jgi:hypothetical protein